MNADGTANIEAILEAELELTRRDISLTQDIVMDLRRELAAKDAEIERLRGGLALCIGLNTNIPYPEVAQRHIDGYCERWAELERMK